MQRERIVDTLVGCGFKEKNPSSWGKARLNDGRKGSLYVEDNYLSATGDYVIYQKKIPPTERDHNDYPVWRDFALKKVITVIWAKNISTSS